MADTISLLELSIAFLPALVVLGLLYYWRGGYRTSGYALLRMLIQLFLIGYILASIFSTQRAWVVGIVLLFMVSIASWISLRTIPDQRRSLCVAGFVGICVGAGSVLTVTFFGVLDLQPWFDPQYVIPLSGMAMAAGMNAISLAAERFSAEWKDGKTAEDCCRIAYEAALIPTTNALFSVGLVSIPGMMTGQILAEVEPHVAARYQIMVMCMVYGSAGISTAVFLKLWQRRMTSDPSTL